MDCRLQSIFRQRPVKCLTTFWAGLMACLCLQACTGVQTRSEFHSSGFLASKENIVLLSNLDVTQDLDDQGVDDCIGAAMRKADPSLSFVPAKQFRGHLYPYFMPGTTPHTLDNYMEIIKIPEVSRRLIPLNVRHLIILISSGTVTDWHGGIFCGSGYGGGGCLGLSWWDRKSDLGVAIWDLKTGTLSGRVQADAAGTGIMPAFVLPVPVYAPATKTAVCRDMGHHLAKLLAGGEIKPAGPSTAISR